MKESYIPSDGIRLHAKLDTPEGFSKGPLVLLIHGFTGHMEEEHIIAAQQVMNEIGYAVLRVEMYGHGGSEGAFKDHTLYKWISNTLSVMDYVRSLDFVTDIYLSGHSQGGLTAALVGGMAPDLVKGLILRAPAFMIPRCAREGSMLGFSFDPLRVPDEMQIIKGLTLSGHYVRTAQTIHAEEAIDRFPGQVLLIHGDADDLVPVEDSKAAAKRYRNCSLAVIPGETHHFDRFPEKMKVIIRDWLTAQKRAE